MHLIVGLGNPGRRYRGSRHNVGWEVLDEVARRAGVALDEEKGWARVGRGTVAGKRVLLARPETYMNLSGVAVADLCRRHRLRPEAVIVLYDDLDLPAGTIRVRARGSHGGHNGIRSIIEELGSTEFPRVRVGLGRPPAGTDPVDYVLSRPTGPERAALDDAVGRAAGAVEDILGEGLEAAMNRHNRRPARFDPELPAAPRPPRE